MSTFKGVVEEFPGIRIDYFRRSSDPGEKPPLACFLSHIHSDHLQGLEGGYNAPFIYCSAATKELLVRLQRKVHRLNFQEGIVETQNCQYKDKKKLLKSIPLETPTWVEVGPQVKVRVTLFDANHCVGAVMFLIEGNGKAVLYTGDIRAEDWWMEYLVRHPLLLPYTSGLKRLDKIYLDTSWGYQACSQKFPSKREGIAGLLKQLVKYPEDTIFHLNTWTFGYEEVWVALASFFHSQIHLGRYHYGLFKSVGEAEKWVNGPYLSGFNLGNASQQQIITTNPDVKIHSCERNTGCAGLQGKRVVYITPVVALVDGVLHQEDGIDYGDLSNNEDFSIHGQFMLLVGILGDELTPEIRAMLLAASKSKKEALQIPLGEFADRTFAKRELLAMLQDAATKKHQERPQRKVPTEVADLYQNWPGTESIRAENGDLLPTWIQLPYARHSSLGELRNFVAAFRPRDVYQNTVDEDAWSEATSVKSLYGHLCSANLFSHDAQMRRIRRSRIEEQRVRRLQLQQAELESQYKELASQHPSSEAGGELGQPEALEAAMSTEQSREDEGEAEHSGDAAPESPSLRHTSPRVRSEVTPPPLPLAAGRGKPNGAGRMPEMPSSPPLPPVPFFPPPPLPPTTATTATAHDADAPSERASPAHRLPGSPRASHTSPAWSISRPCKRPPQPSSDDVAAARESKLARLDRDESSTMTADVKPMEGREEAEVEDIPPRGRGGGIEDLRFAECLTQEVLEGDDSLDLDRVEEAVCAALEVSGEDWWSIELESTRRRWRYEREVEL